MPRAKQPPKHRQCGVQSATERLYEQDPNLRGRHRRIEDECQNLIAKGYAQRVWRKLSTIPVIVHVVSKTDEEDISDEQVESQIDVLNQDYRGKNADRSKVPDAWSSLVADPNIQFALAKKDPKGKPTTGITRVQTTRDSSPPPAGRFDASCPGAHRPAGAGTESDAASCRGS